ncbi:MAG: type II toxin-antitoxin system VapC family toxin [Stagnimonas sp.]|nr:type II toxin-antitoxin system VapC family toxin [Stagnimonas sp.]
MEVVFDCSAIMSCLAPDEKSPPEWRELLSTATLVAPCMLPTELVNAIITAQRRKRMSADEAQQALAIAGALDFVCEAPSMIRSSTAVHQIAMEHQLTAYDASYLELALRRRLPLATLDGDLIKAAKKAKVKLA